MYKLAAFDLDGTLVNTLFDLAFSVNRALSAIGLKEQPIDRYKTFVGNGRDIMIRRAMGEQGSDERLFSAVKAGFDKEYAVHCCDTSVGYEGCERMLGELSKFGVLTAVLSNKPDEYVSGILEKAFPSHSFCAAWGQKPQYPKKPDPKALLEILDKFNISPKDCIYIGDSDVDVLTAKNAGTAFAGVEWGFRSRGELEAEGAQLVASSAEELLSYILEK